MDKRNFNQLPRPELGKTVYADCPCCGYKKALAITQTDERTLYFCHAGCSQEGVWQAIHGYCPSRTTERGNRQRENRTTDAFLRTLWRESVPASGTLVETYLKSRGITCPVPHALRFLPHHLHKPTGTTWPVMLAAVEDNAGRLQAVHRTYLALDGTAKAPVEPPKMTLGPIGSFACHLAEANTNLAVSEGIETGLSVQSVADIPTWAALSAGGMRKLILPPLPLALFVIIAADADAVGIKSAQIAASRWRAEGRDVRILVPPRPGMDFNDLLLEPKP